MKCLSCNSEIRKVDLACAPRETLTLDAHPVERGEIRLVSGRAEIVGPQLCADLRAEGEDIYRQHRCGRRG